MNLDEWLDVPNESNLSSDSNIIFVCVGNINRSPAAETILKEMLKYSKLKWKVSSAAISPKNEGKCTTKKMRDTLVKNGYEYNEIRSKPLTQQMIDIASVIYIMDNANYKKMIEKFGEELVVKKVRFLGDINPGKFGRYVSDPHFAKGTEEHQKVVEQIESNLQRLVEIHENLCAKL